MSRLLAALSREVSPAPGCATDRLRKAVVLQDLATRLLAETARAPMTSAADPGEVSWF